MQYSNVINTILVSKREVESDLYSEKRGECVGFQRRVKGREGGKGKLQHWW